MLECRFRASVRPRRGRDARRGRRLVDAVVQGRGARRRHRRARRIRSRPAPGDVPAAFGAGPERMVGRARRGACRGRPRIGCRRDVRGGAAARPGRHRRRGRSAAAGQALERHRVGSRRGLAARSARRRCGGVGERVRVRPGVGVHDRQAVLAAPLRTGRLRADGTRDAPARLAGVASHGGVRHRPRRRVRHRVLVPRERCVPLRPAGDRRPRSRLVGAPARGAGTRARARHRRQHGRGARARPPAGRCRDLARHVRHGVRGERHAHARRVGRGRRLRRRHRPLPPARLHAQRDEGHRHRGELAGRRPRRARRPWGRLAARRAAAPPCCPISTASARRTARTRRDG